MNFQQLTPRPQWLVFTDLDGTLLDHDTYSFKAAQASLDRLREHNIPVIINSSKTAAEINDIRRQLNNTHPFIIENGSAIIQPSNDLTAEQRQSLSTKQTLILGYKRQHILEHLAPLKSLFPDTFRSYHDCSTQDIVDMTGLSHHEASLSAQREYTEPVQWMGNDDDKKAFMEAAKQLGLQCLHGGRFIHLMGPTDKGAATKALSKQYIDAYQKPIKTIALGDSENDIAMFQAADVAVVIRSPHFPPPEFEHPHKIISHYYGPEGWHECIDKLFLLTLAEPEEA